MKGGPTNDHDLLVLRHVLRDLAERTHRAIVQLDGYVKTQDDAHVSTAGERSPPTSPTTRASGEPTRSPPHTVVPPNAPVRAPLIPGHSRGVTRALRHIELYFERPIALRRLARVAGCSQSTLTRAFRRELGQTPHEYLVAIRLTRAAVAMDAGDKVESVMLWAGFRSKRNFYRQFKAQFGRTPSHYRSHAEPAEPSATAPSPPRRTSGRGRGVDVPGTGGPAVT